MVAARRFQDLEYFTNDDVNDAILRNDPAELALVSITVALSSPDAACAQDVCLRLGVYKDPRVRGNAVMCLGHLARRFRSLDEPRVRPLIEASLRDSDDYVRTLAVSAADEVHQFLGWEFPGHVYGEMNGLPTHE